MQCILFGIPIKVVEHPDVIGSDIVHMGRSDASQGVIWVNSTLPGNIKEQVLVHEWLHLVSDSLGLGCTEQQITALATVLYAEGFNPFKEHKCEKTPVRNRRKAVSTTVSRR